MQNLANCLYATVNKRDKVTVVGNQLLVHQKKCHLYTYPPEFEIYIQNCVYKPELHEKGPIILAC